MDRKERRRINSANASKQGRNSFWTDARTALLFALAFEKLGASAIAVRIGDGCTKNMVIGKAKREKLKLRSRAGYRADLAAEAGKRKAAAIRRRIEKLQARLADAEKRSQCGSVSRETQGATRP